MAPEKIQREKEDVSFRTFYSLGYSLYHAITGHVPFDAATVEAVVAAHVHTPLTPPNDVVPEISQLTSDALVKVLAKRPQERYLSYDEFANALSGGAQPVAASHVPE